MSEDIFPFVYAGSGFFRRKGVPKGDKAATLHAMQAIDYVLEQVKLHSDSVDIVKRISTFAHNNPRFVDVLLTKEEALKGILSDAKKLFPDTTNE